MSIDPTQSQILDDPSGPFQGWVRELDDSEISFRPSDAFMFGIKLAFRHPEYARALTHTGFPEVDDLESGAIDGLMEANPIKRIPV